MRTFVKFVVSLSAMAAVQLPTAHAAGSMAGSLNAQVLLQDGCIVSGAPGAGSTGVNFGTLDFGTQPAAFSGVLTATPTGGAGGAGPTQIQCSSDVSFVTITIGAGNNAGQGGAIGLGSRALRMGSSANYLPYEVYSDAAMTVPYPTNGTAYSYTPPSSGNAWPLPVFGRIDKTSTSALPGGSYVDVLVVTLSW